MPRLITFLTSADPLPTDDKILMVKYLGILEEDLKQFVPLLEGLSTLGKRYGKNEGIVTGTKALSNLLINIRMESRHNGTITESKVYQNYWEMKTWVP